jgi:LacI family transcriptional regulator
VIDMKKITSTDVAKLAGVSQTTVSMILNGKVGSSFSEETKNKVLDAAKQLGYIVPAQNILPNNNNLIAVFIPTLSNYYYPQLVSCIEKYASSQGYKILICNTSRSKADESYYLNYLSKLKITGIIFTYIPLYPKLVEQLSLSIPIVLIGEKNEKLTIPSIELNNLKAGYLMGEYLISLNHSYFAFFSTPFNKISLARRQRLDGLKQALSDHGMEQNVEVYSRDYQSESDIHVISYEYELGYDLTEKFFESKCPATALIGVNDMTALGIIGCLEEHGKQIPKDYSVCGFDNIFAGRLSTPTLTTIDHHLDSRGQAAVDMILSKNTEMNQKKQPNLLNSLINKIEYDPQLLIRKSTGPV